MRQRSKKVRLFGFIFDSQSEGERAIYLKSLADKGVIESLVFDKTDLKVTLQPALTIEAIPRIGLTSRKMRAITYTPDFRYDFEGIRVWEDSKALDKRTGKPRIETASVLRIKMFQNGLLLTRLPRQIMRVVTKPTADPDDEIGYWYSLNERI